MSKESERFFKEPVTNIQEYRFNKENGDDTGNLPNELFEIISIYENDCDQSLKTVSLFRRKFSILGYNSDGRLNMLEMELRDNTLRLETVEFIHKGEGNFSKLYRILKRIRVQYDLNKIVIQQVSTKEMKEICEHYGFIRLGAESDSYSDYIEP